ncbi:MAG: diguanylate cyclase [Eubacterium sp.]|nr:diguanylate cyclase [Eubacterium sp.]
MKRFDKIKTIQLFVMIVLAAAAVLLIVRDTELYHLMAVNPHVKMLGALLWILLAGSFLFLFYDFNSYADLRRENMELDHAVYSDALTGMANRYSVDVYIGQFLNKPLPADLGCITLDLVSLSEINRRHGHSGGDTAIQAFSDILLAAANGVCFVGRNGGNKFVAIFRDCTQARLQQFLEKVQAQTDQYNQMHPDAALVYTQGTASAEEETVESVTELVALSDRRALQEG